MRASASAPSLAIGGQLTLGKPRSLVVPRGAVRCWSNPAHAAAFSLRKYAAGLKHIPAENVVRAAFRGDPLEIPIGNIDLIGGNGKFRQIKAEEEFARRRVQAEVEHRQEVQYQAEKKHHKAEQAEKKRLYHEQEEKRWNDEREQKRQESVETAKRKQEEEDERRKKRQLQEEERKRRMPKTCETCDGSGKCQECHGKGQVFSLFLVHRTNVSDVRTPMDHGRVHQGCDKCGGFSHNMLGDLKKGTGECPTCQGLGKIWPFIDEDTLMSSPMSPKSKPSMSSFQIDRDRTSSVVV